MAAPAARTDNARLPWLVSGVVVGAVVLLLNAYLPQRALDWVEDSVLERDRRQATTAIAKDLLSALKDMAAGESGYLISGDERFLEPYDRGGAEVPRLLAQIESQVEGTKALEVVAQLRPAVATVVLVQGRVVDARRSGDVELATQIVQRGESKVALDRVRLLSGQLIAVEEAAGAALLEETRRRKSALSAWLAALTAIDLLVFGAVFFFAFKQLRHRAAVQVELAAAGRQLEESVRRLEQSNARGKLLARMDDALQSCVSVDEALAIIPKFCAQLLERYPGIVYFMQPSRDLLEPGAHWGVDGAQVELMEPGDCLALRRGQAYQLTDPAVDAVCAHVQRQPGGAGARLCLPMNAHGEVIGLMSLDLAQARAAMPDADRDLAATAAEQISLSVANLRLREQLRRQSIVDSLTGLYNRRFLDESLKREFARAERKRLPLAVVLIDVDHFKRWNDKYGHEAGDHVLRLVGGALQQGVRSSDIACRYGGEEFALVLPEAGLETAQARAESLRRVLAEIEVHYGGQMLERVTASFGVAVLPLHGSTPAELLFAADAALYLAKQYGRNQVVAAEPRAPAADLTQVK